MYQIKRSELDLITIISIFILLASFYIYIIYPNDIYGWYSDSAWYLLMADYYKHHNAAENSFLKYIAEKNIYPPLYPWLLSLFDAGSKNIHSAHIVTTFILIGAFILFYKWMRTEKQSMALALITVVIFAALPITLFQTMWVMSESLYIFLVFMVFLIIAKAKTDPRYFYVAAITIGLVTITRTAGFVLVPALFFYLIIRRQKNVILFISLSILPMIILKIHQLLLGNDTGYMDLYLNYVDKISMQVIVGTITNNLVFLWMNWINCFDYSANQNNTIILTILLIFSIVGLIYRLRQKCFDAYYIIIYIIVIILWPYSNEGERFLFVILPILLFYGQLGVSYAINSINIFRHFSFLPYVYGALIFLVLAPDLGIILKRMHIKPTSIELKAYTRTPGWLLTTPRHLIEQNTEIVHRYIVAAREISHYIPEDQCIYAAWSEFVMLYSHRISIKPPVSSVSNEDFNYATRKCNYYFMINLGTNPPIYSSLYPLERIKDSVTPIFMSRFRGKQEIDSIVAILAVKKEK